MVKIGSSFVVRNTVCYSCVGTSASLTKYLPAYGLYIMKDKSPKQMKKDTKMVKRIDNYLAGKKEINPSITMCFNAKYNNVKVK